MGARIAIVGTGAVGGYAGAHMAKAGEDVNQTGHGANQPDQRRDTRDHFKDDQAAFQSHHFMAGPGLNGFDIVGA